MYIHSNKGFSLVELSIVLVIIGLLTGGILSGQTLIRAAELRAVTTEYDQYKTAIVMFKDKYYAIPGDMKNATKFWGAANPSPATCITTVGTGTQTCNGNGDGKFDTLSTASVHTEFMMFWQHLANAGLITGQYTGMSGPGIYYHSIGNVNVPQSRMNSGAWFIFNDFAHVSAFYPAAVKRHNLRLGQLTADRDPINPLFTASEMWAIDEKIDDGKPGLGAVTTYLQSFGGGPNCTTSNIESTAEYYLSTSVIGCIFLGETGF